jgi:glycosyltransferase involved in cell wall biosynthesis
VAVPPLLPNTAKESFFLTASRLVPYKNTRSIVEAFRDLPNEKLIVVGTGPDYEHLKATATANVEFRGFVPDAELRHLMGAARAFIFAAEEDFGIVVVEAQAEGTPVLALGRGGARETIIDDPEYPTGMFFLEHSPAEIRRTVSRFIEIESCFSPWNCHQNALRFSEERFEREFTDFVEGRLMDFARRLAMHRPRYVRSVALHAEVL